MHCTLYHDATVFRSGRLGTLLCKELEGFSSSSSSSDSDVKEDQNNAVRVTVVQPFTFNIGNYAPWAGTTGDAGDAGDAGGIRPEDERAAVDAVAQVSQSHQSQSLLRECLFRVACRQCCALPCCTVWRVL